MTYDLARVQDRGERRVEKSCGSISIIQSFSQALSWMLDVSSFVGTLYGGHARVLVGVCQSYYIWTREDGE